MMKPALTYHGPGAHLNLPHQMHSYSSSKPESSMSSSPSRCVVHSASSSPRHPNPKPESQVSHATPSPFFQQELLKYSPSKAESGLTPSSSIGSTSSSSISNEFVDAPKRSTAADQMLLPSAHQSPTSFWPESGSPCCLPTEISWDNMLEPYAIPGLGIDDWSSLDANIPSPPSFDLPSMSLDEPLLDEIFS